MSRVTEIARILGCTESNVCYLLRRGRIKGKKTSAGWMVSDEAVQEYLASPKVQLHPIKLKLHKGQKFGYWTVLNPDAERSKSGQRTALVRCICGKTKRVSIIDLLYGHSRSGHTGVCWRENMQKYYAYIMVNRKQISLGLYTELDDAIVARKAAEEKYFRPRQERVDAIKKGMVKD